MNEKDLVRIVVMAGKNSKVYQGPRDNLIDFVAGNRLYGFFDPDKDKTIYLRHIKEPYLRGKALIN